MKTYILILMIKSGLAGYGGGLSAEFVSMEACKTATTAYVEVTKFDKDVVALCVPKDGQGEILKWNKRWI